MVEAAQDRVSVRPEQLELAALASLCITVLIIPAVTARARIGPKTFMPTSLVRSRQGRASRGRSGRSETAGRKAKPHRSRQTTGLMRRSLRTPFRGPAGTEPRNHRAPLTHAQQGYDEAII